MLHLGFPLSIRNVEELFDERGFGLSHQRVRFWWRRFGPMYLRSLEQLGHPFTVNMSLMMALRTSSSVCSILTRRSPHVHASVFNHFNPERSHSNRNIF